MEPPRIRTLAQDLGRLDPSQHTQDSVVGPTLCKAAENGDHDTVKRLLADKGDPNELERNGTPLLYAVHGGHPEIARTLLEHGADVNAVTKDKRNCSLYLAARDGNESIVKLLLKHGADISHANRHILVACTQMGDTPLHGVDLSRRSALAKLLVDHGADVQARNLYDKLPIDDAAWSSHVDLVNLLNDVAFEGLLRLQNDMLFLPSDIVELVAEYYFTAQLYDMALSRWRSPAHQLQRWMVANGRKAVMDRLAAQHNTGNVSGTVSGGSGPPTGPAPPPALVRQATWESSWADEDP